MFDWFRRREIAALNARIQGMLSQQLLFAAECERHQADLQAHNRGIRDTIADYKSALMNRDLLIQAKNEALNELRLKLATSTEPRCHEANGRCGLHGQKLINKKCPITEIPLDLSLAPIRRTHELGSQFRARKEREIEADMEKAK